MSQKPEKDITKTLYNAAKIYGPGTPLDNNKGDAGVPLGHRIQFIDNSNRMVDDILNVANGPGYQAKTSLNYAKHQATDGGVTQPAGYLNARRAWLHARNSLIEKKKYLLRAAEAVSKNVEHIDKVLEETEWWEQMSS